MNLLDTNIIISLYDKYKDELLKIGMDIRLFLDENCRKGLNPQFSDIESEITYMFLRELVPENVVEFSPYHGYSTMWILNALKDNNSGTLFSFDLVDDSVRYVPDSLKERWVFVKGDVKKNINRFPKKIDYLFIDSNHSKEFSQWYIKNIFPMVGNIYISVHDVLKRHISGRLYYGEAVEMLKWLKQNNIQYFGASTKYDIGDLQLIDNNARLFIDKYKKENKFIEVNKYGKTQRNSAIFFRKVW